MSIRRRRLPFLFAVVLTGGILLLSQGQVAYAAESSVTMTTYILGIQSDAQTAYLSISWLRLSYSTCGNSNLSGQGLRDTVRNYHRQGIRVLLTVCQPDLSVILDPTYLNDAAQGRADAIECGNEQMKNDPPYTRYVPPDLYAQFFDLCESSMHAVRPQVPVLLGSLDPHVVGPDNQLLAQQVAYLNAVQAAMNTIVHPGGNWSWQSHSIGLIDSWHNGYPRSSDNNLYQLFVFWAQQFQVDLNSGQLAQHLWVVEGTACFMGCGLTGTYQVAVSHILTLITDVLTTLQYGIPFFYFTGKDFVLNGVLFPIGVLDVNRNPKPLRQDLSIGARTLNMTCPSGKLNVAQQEQLLALLYSGCQLPSNYVSILES
jgi:hypothetical protein